VKRSPISRSLLRIALVALAVAALVLPATAAAGNRSVVEMGRVPSLGKVLTNDAGHTLYSLSAETRGRFICDNTYCLGFWTPLVVRAGTRPTGPVRLGTVRRPDGKIQVTYKGLPLYTFNEDSRAGQAKGEGFKDVGTWHAAQP
jgi:predicted lipoprotein with Yx(FWY)xxD motif